MLEQAKESWTIFEAAHLLNRAGFGGNPSEIKSFHALGREKAVDLLIVTTEPLDAFPPPAWSVGDQALASLRARQQAFKKNSRANVGMSPEEAERAKKEAIKMIQQEGRQEALDMHSWWFHRMLKSLAPLREKMTLFWHDHFATSIQKVKEPLFLVNQNDLFRRNALGSFKDLTQAILMDPAMMLYLDTQSSKKGKPNENFAREVMELFTLGEGNYTEQDVHEAARAFSGYYLNKGSGKVAHDKRQWDSADKTIFGKTGPFNGKDVIGLIFEKKEAARFMVKKLWEFFVYENPSDAAIESLSVSFQRSDFQVAPLLRDIFLSKEFYTESAIRSQIKSPIQYLIELLKQLEITDPSTGFVVSAQQQLGQVLFMPPNVAGWDWGQAWINTNTLLTRYNIAGFVTKGTGGDEKSMDTTKVKSFGKDSKDKRMGRAWYGPNYKEIAPHPLREIPSDLVDSLIFRFFQCPLPDKARKSFIEYATSEKGVIFTDKEIAQLCHLMLSTPSYQLC